MISLLIVVLACTLIGWLCGHPIPGLIAGIGLALITGEITVAY